jgi:ribosome assembly protein YihI (activator of Der GTPase)
MSGEENLEDKSHRDEGDPDSRQRRKQRRARSVAPNPRAEERGRDFDHAAEKSRDERDFPCEVGVVRLAINRPEDEKR